MAIDRTHVTALDGSVAAALADINAAYTAINGLKDGAVDTADGNVNASTVTIDADATSTGDRSLIFKLTSSLSRLFKYSSSSGRLRVEDQAGALVPLDVADPSNSASAATKNYVDTQIAALQLEITGVAKPYFGTSAPTGYVLADGKTIGDASSSGTERANADCQTLFTLLWNSMSNTEAAVSSGRGANAAADWAAHKTIALPDLRGRSPLGLDNMGGTVAGRVTSASTGGPATTLGGAGGEETHTLIVSEVPALTYTKPVIPGSPNVQGGSGLDACVSTTSASTNGGGGAHNNMQPWLAVNYIIKL